MLMDAGGLFTQLNGGEEKGQKKQLVSVRGGELLIDFHGSCLGLITHKATVIKKKSATGNLRGDVARISRGFHQIPELVESQSVPIAEAVFFLPPIFFFLSLGQRAVNGVGANDSRPLPICYRGIFTGRERRRRDRAPTQSAEEPLPS